LQSQAVKQLELPSVIGGNSRIHFAFAFEKETAESGERLIINRDSRLRGNDTLGLALTTLTVSFAACAILIETSAMSGLDRSRRSARTHSAAQTHSAAALPVAVSKLSFS
jgi:hypothetical protein